MRPRLSSTGWDTVVPLAFARICVAQLGCVPSSGCYLGSAAVTRTVSDSSPLEAPGTSTWSNRCGNFGTPSLQASEVACPVVVARKLL